MSEPKYYTPELSEFHVGFEYEEFWNDKPRLHKNGYWKPKVLSPLELGNIVIERLQRGDFRVKFLDRQDIESLGWKAAYYNEYEFSNGEFTLEWWGNKHDTEIKKGGHTVFVGTIRNKSELARVMKMVGITK